MEIEMDDYPTEFGLVFDDDDCEWLMTKKEKRILADAQILSSNYEAVTLEDKTVFSPEAWKMFEVAYRYIGGFHSYLNVLDMINTSKMIQIIYDKPFNSKDGFDPNKCYAIATYNEKCGLKMTSLIQNRSIEKLKSQAAAIKLGMDSLGFSWNESAMFDEYFIMKYCGGKSKIIPPEQIAKIYDIQVDEDGIHYYRRFSTTGTLERKIACGTIR